LSDERISEQTSRRICRTVGEVTIFTYCRDGVWPNGRLLVDHFGKRYAGHISMGATPLIDELPSLSIG